ncbi:uncharacterized protein LOC129908665 [Episyrphus balteatus]|uniref:uncharacterized protein LOC129908665 n=1 Tax=Episyrphus balteatus TaxID=286459 RepID=UPI0024867D68|nr:uncharacterized protein LOC129908665 [Episyrphus balteatus]
MKLQIILFVLVAMALSALTEKSTGRRSNIRLVQLLRNQKDSPSKARFLHKKQQAAPAQPTILVVQPGYTTSTGSSPVSYSYSVTTDGTQTISPASRKLAEQNESFNDDDDDKIWNQNEEEAEVEADAGKDEEDNDQTSPKHQKQKKNLKLQKINVRDQDYKFVIPEKYMRSIKKNAHASRSSNFNNGVNKLRLLRNNDKGHIKRKLSSN